MSTPPYRLPGPGDLVGQYRVVAPLGQGGQGYVYKAECAGRLVVLKFFRSRPVCPSGELEIDILRHLQHPNVVRVLGYGWWPDPEWGFLYIVMEYVEGLTLLAHALEHNPSARQAATLLLGAARALGVVHRRGVLHRDIKPENLLVRTADGQPVWVDFGVGHLEGRTTPPGRSGLPPGTPEFTSPEAYRFLQEHGEEARYQPGVADEVWALGVTAYELLTDELPFGSRVGNPRMVRHIRTRTPEAPHERNPRVPVALSRVCMHLLEKQPGARPADMEAVAAALETALARADTGWDVPLVDPDAPQVRTTEEIPGKVVDRDTWERFKQEFKAMKPRRGRVRKARRGPPPPKAPAPSAPPLGRTRVVAVALVGVLLGALVGVSPWGVQPLPPGRLESHPTPHAFLGGEVAVPREQSEAGGGAVPFVPLTPASTLATMIRKEDARLKKQEKPAPRPQRKAPDCVPTTQRTCVAGICTLLLTGCTTTTTQVVRPPPQPADCPPIALKTMEELGIRMGVEVGVGFPHEGGVKPVTVRESTPVVLKDTLGKLQAGTEFSGRLYLGAERVYGRFTQARTLGGKTYPVCLELRDGGKDALGAVREDVGGPADAAVVLSSQDALVVDHFE
ncbi:serine/threonine-protein kinase [Archangium sp.]|uniref:serine/threonine-protein kinase n=1 Tax=Archangium sp. TaxID=1872627 RepID=UPI002EDA3880